MKRDGFTLLESLVVLMLVAISFTICWPKFNYHWDCFEQEQFFHRLRAEWQLAQSSAKNNQEETDISYNHSHVDFVNADYHHQLKLPRKLKMRDHTDLTMHADGYVRPCTWEFCSEIDHRVYYMHIQMAWGGYRIEKGGFYTG